MGRVVILLAALGAGCSSPGELAPSPVALVELLHGRHESAIFLIKGAAEVDELRSWIRSCYKEPPPPNEIGAVFPAGAVLFPRPGDADFVGPPAQTFVLYGPLDAGGTLQLVPTADLDRLAAWVQRAGAPYEGSVRSGTYAPKLWEDGASPGLLGITRTYEAPFDALKKASLEALAELGYSVKKQGGEDKARHRMLASRRDPKSGTERFALIVIEQGGCVSLRVRTRSDANTVEADDRAAQELSERINDWAGRR
jgi:hypothetical protein